MSTRAASVPKLLAVALVAAVALTGIGCGGDDNDEVPGASSSPVVEDPGPVHVHGLGINPKDGALFIATHTGLYRSKGREEPKRVAGRFQDTMGFTVVGPDRFLGSGHPDGREKLPPFLGLIRTADAGKEWEPISLLGKRDFHVLEAAGRHVYGFGSDYESRSAGFLVSSDDGKTWQERAVPESLIALAIDPRDPKRIVASGQKGLFVSTDAGQGWRPMEGPAGLLTWTEAGLTVVDQVGAAHRANDPGEAMEETGDVNGAPAALDSGPDGDLYVALHDGTIKRSADGGRTWTVRSRKPE